jgi:hypothetical protein
MLLQTGFSGFFSPGAPTVFLRERYAGYIIPCRVLVVVQITIFLSSVRGLECLIFYGSAGALLQSQFGVLSLCVPWGQAS